MPCTISHLDGTSSALTMKLYWEIPTSNAIVQSVFRFPSRTVRYKDPENLHDWVLEFSYSNPPG